MITLNGITKHYTTTTAEPVPALDGLSLEIATGELMAIVGTSGSGKSTLLNVLGLLDRPTDGSYVIDGHDVTKLSAREHAKMRNQRFGFVFQAFRLLPRASALENVELPLLYSDRRNIGGVARSALEQVGLSDRIHHRPAQLSGGQQQRVAIARALVNNPDVILADEPTGNLDAASALDILNLLFQLHRDGRTVILVTHDMQIAEHCQRVARIERGKVVADRRTAPLEMFRTTAPHTATTQGAPS